MAKRKLFGTSALIGETIWGLSRPVFFDPHYPIMQNNSPMTQITGSPGSGKTFLLLDIIAQAGVMGKLVFVIDPKADAVALKKLEQTGELKKVNIFNIFGDDNFSEIDSRNIGLLDPLSLMESREENVSLTIDVIQSLVPNITTKQENALLPIVKDVVNSSTASLFEVVRRLSSNQNEEVRNLGLQLDIPLKTAVAKLLVADRRDRSTYENPFIQASGVTVISLLGLSLPDPNKKREEYSTAERLSTIIMRLLNELILQAMSKQPKQVQKLLVIDEAWVVFGNDSGRDLISRTALLGRSLNMAVVLATQSPRHLASGTDEESSLNTAISTRFAFRNTSELDNKITVRAMRLPEDGGWEQAFLTFKPGQCLMRDSNGGIDALHVTVNEGWQEVFDTNPEAVLKKAK